MPFVNYNSKIKEKGISDIKKEEIVSMFRKLSCGAREKILEKEEIKEFEFNAESTFLSRYDEPYTTKYGLTVDELREIHTEECIDEVLDGAE